MSRYEWREGYGLWDSARGTYLLLGDNEHARILWAALNAQAAAPELPPLAAYVFNVESWEYEPHASPEHVIFPPECYLVEDVDKLLAALRAELERLRREVTSAQHCRGEEYRQREAWRAKAGRLEEVLGQIAKRPQPDKYTDWTAWHTWAMAVQELAEAWGPEDGNG